MAFGFVPLALGRDDPVSQVKTARAHLDLTSKASQKRALDLMEIQSFPSRATELRETIKESDGPVNVVREMLKKMDERR